MSLICYLLFSFAIGISAFTVLHGCAQQSQVPLLRGLGVSLCMAFVGVVLYELGVLLGNVLRFGLSEVDRLVFLGIMVVVAIRMMMSAYSKNEFSYDISRFATMVALSVATGINAFLVGIGVGFVAIFKADIIKSMVPMAVLVSLLSLWSIMLGRQKVEIRARRWMFLATLMLLVSTLAGYFF